MSSQEFRIAVIIGSTREGRFGPIVADWFRDQAAAHPEIVPDLVDLADFEGHGPDLADRLGAADGFVVVTPEYNHSYPAALKQAIDSVHAQWQAKPVAFVSYGGISGGLRAVEHLRPVFAELHTVTIRETVSFAGAWSLFDESGRLRDPSAAEAAAKLQLDQLLWWARALRQARDAHPYAA